LGASWNRAHIMVGLSFCGCLSNKPRKQVKALSENTFFDAFSENFSKLSSRTASIFDYRA
jgi:hypothetical protein